ncbi:hypothetical protein [Paenibacillus xylanexedens]|uniref:hypothetical protein n=1 Tax=Paenibacillus xylanexedens TaxID=528191 RepID=UPI0011AA9211|nr:hypothetical protein [Paenibacillus xylanexedens]
MESITYSRKTAVYKSFVCFVFILVAFILLYEVLTADLNFFQYAYYGSASLLCFWFFGPAWFSLAWIAVANEPILVRWDKSQILLNNGKSVPWSIITRIELKRPFLRKWAQHSPPFYRLHLHHNKFEDISTFHMLTGKELTTYLGMLRQRWHLYKDNM